jgi:hypothetical protein
MRSIYVRVGVNLIDHPRTLNLDGDSFAMYVGGLIYAQKHLTDGFLPADAIDSLVPRKWVARSSRSTRVQRLVRSGLWVKVEGGYQIRNYLDWQRSRSDVEKQREATRDRVRKHRGNGVTR